MIRAAKVKVKIITDVSFDQYGWADQLKADLGGLKKKRCQLLLSPNGQSLLISIQGYVFDQLSRDFFSTKKVQF